MQQQSTIRPTELTFGIVSSRPTGKGSEQAPLDQYTVTVGEMIQHLAVSNVPILSVVWTIAPSTNVAAYDVGIDNATLTYLPQADLIVNPLIFAWGDAGDAQVVISVEITTEYGTGTASNSFTITSPTIGDISCEMGVPTVFVNPAGQTMFQLMMPGGRLPIRSGVQIDVQVNGTQAADGIIAFFQLANNARFQTVGNISQHLSTNGEFILDIGDGQSVIYQDVTSPLPSNQSATIYITDAPGTALPNPPGAMNMYAVGDENPPTEMYQSYLMFLANTPGSIWVPVALVNWSWAGFCAVDDGAWGDPLESTVTCDGGRATYDFPLWQTNTSTSDWVYG